MCIRDRFPELRHLAASDAQFREKKGIVALQMVADIACVNADCLRVGDIGVIKRGACGLSRPG
eukprot:6920449-Alexandrium_andersonii.AAC.1